MKPNEFSALYMNDPVSADAVEFKPAWIKKDELTQELSNKLLTGIHIFSVDPAFRLKQTNDYSGLVITTITPDNFVYVRHAEQKKLNARDLINEIFRLVDIYNPDRFLVETVAAQLLLVDMLQEEMRKRNKFFVVEEVKPNTTETKAVRIRGLIPSYANGRIIHVGNQQVLETQLMEFPRGLHDDVIDAFAYQVPFWKKPETLKVPNDIVPGSWLWWKRLAKKPETQTEKLFSDFRGM